MKGYRFYEELENKGRKGERSAGNVVALILEQDERGHWWPIYMPTFAVECICGLFAEPNSPVCGGQTARSYLWDKCRRVSEKRAREIHPALFEYLD